MDSKIHNDTVTVFLDASLFSRDAIFKCLYWYGDKFHVTITKTEDELYKITLSFLPQKGGGLDELNSLRLKLERDLFDFNLRDIVSKETKNVRDLLIAKAFSNGEFDESPKGELSDPVGFDPNKFTDS